MRRYFREGTSGSQYRRGAIMGLTVAEAFMLVAFVLLMLLLFWRHQVQDDIELVSELSSEDRRALSEGAVPVPEERLTVLQVQARLVEDPARRELAEAAAALEPYELRKLTDLARDPDALSTDAVPVPEERLAALEERAGLVEDPKRRALAETAATLEPDALQRLTDLARDPDALSTDAVPVSPERLAALEDHEQWVEENGDEIAEALNLRRALDPEGEDSNEVLLDRIRDLLTKESDGDSRLAAVKDRLAEDAAARGEFIDNLKRELAADVGKAGGQIDPSGRVVFPETVVFETGSAVIPLSFKAVLDDICPRWLAELRDSADRFDIAEIRIEGHSSPEWASAQTKRDAWVANLGLSQRRAQSVLAHCLDHAAGTPLGEWARGKLTAVGYSSSRPVTVDGKEDPGASRRVVLGHEFNRDRLIADLGDVGRMETGSGATRPLGGKALVIDADTIKIGEAATRIRLDGIDAPELQQTCIAADGSEWPCGREAGRALEAHIAGRNVVCERLRPGLMRLWGVCRIDGEEVELNRWVVEAGWAFAFVEFSRDYAGDEATARMAHRGIWSGQVPVPPWEWRRNRKRAAP